MNIFVIRFSPNQMPPYKWNNPKMSPSLFWQISEAFGFKHSNAPKTPGAVC